ncbi:hypothetical protein V8C37DRAFT_371908 [Trichoderma ceciliae]
MNAKAAPFVSSTREGHHGSAQNRRAATACRFFQIGSCNKGSSCPFLHDTSLLSHSAAGFREQNGQLEKAARNHTPAAASGGAKPICKYFKVGSCIFGERCMYRHAEEELAVHEPFELQDEPKKDDFTRTIGGAFVRFEAGARVSKIRLPSDFSAVRINGLQQNASEQSVRDMLAGRGFDVSVDDIYMLRTEGSCGATVKSDDASFSKRLCALVRPGYTWRGANIYATPVAAPMPSGHNTRRVDCKKVHVSWHKAVKNVWLSFDSRDIAQEVSDMFSQGAYRILGQKVVVDVTPEAEYTVPRWSASMNRLVWLVMLTEVPAAVERSDILQTILQEGHKPRNVKMGPPSYSTDAEQASTVIRSLLTSIGTVEYWEVTLETNARRVKATARFLDESDARRAAMELDKKELPFHRKARLTVQIVYSAKFKVSSSIYTAVQSRISAQQSAWRDDNISFRAYPSTDPLRRFRVLKIEGESAERVASAKAGLESLLAGVVAEEDGVGLWDPSLKANGQLYQAMKRLEGELSVIILRDRVKSELRLFGAQRSCEEAQHQLAELIRNESHSASTRVIELEPHKFFWACHGGFKKIVGRLGPEKASFDIISTPKKIIISGPLEDYDVALAIMEGREQVTEPPTGPPGSDGAAQECSVCWTEAETPIKTSCGHIYCLECFESSCTVGDWAATDLAILCHGSQGNCRGVIGLEDLQEHLSSAALEDVLEQSFSSYIKRNPQQFRYCPTPDCGYIYRVTSGSRTQICSNCLRPTCSACHEPHINMSCAEYRDIKSGGYEALLKLKKELGIKDCPTCKTPLEKISGCNHMTCTVCRAHICWVCMMTFSEGNAVYEHMVKSHGGIIEVPDVY